MLLPGRLRCRGLSQLAAKVTSDTYFQEWLAGEQASLTLRFAEGSVAVRSLGTSCLLVLCTVQTNEQLLSMSLTQVVRRLKATGGGRARPDEPPTRASEPPPPTAVDRLQAIARAELGEHAEQAIEILAAAGSKPKDLIRAIADVERLVRLFISKKKAEELGREMQMALDT